MHHNVTLHLVHRANSTGDPPVDECEKGVQLLKCGYYRFITPTLFYVRNKLWIGERSKAQNAIEQYFSRPAPVEIETLPPAFYATPETMQSFIQNDKNDTSLGSLALNIMFIQGEQLNQADVNSISFQCLVTECKRVVFAKLLELITWLRAEFSQPTVDLVRCICIMDDYDYLNIFLQSDNGCL